MPLIRIVQNPNLGSEFASLLQRLLGKGGEGLNVFERSNLLNTSLNGYSISNDRHVSHKIIDDLNVEIVNHTLIFVYAF